MFKKGDLFFLNEEGVVLFQYILGENGIIMSDPYLLLEGGNTSNSGSCEYYGYDILIQGRLYIEIPEKFLLRMIKREENIE